MNIIKFAQDQSLVSIVGIILLLGLLIGVNL